jgi:hypothetical protein
MPTLPATECASQHFAVKSRKSEVQQDEGCFQHQGAIDRWVRAFINSSTQTKNGLTEQDCLVRYCNEALD